MCSFLSNGRRRSTAKVQHTTNQTNNTHSVWVDRNNRQTVPDQPSNTATFHAPPSVHGQEHPVQRGGAKRRCNGKQLNTQNTKSPTDNVNTRGVHLEQWQGPSHTKSCRGTGEVCRLRQRNICINAPVRDGSVGPSMVPSVTRKRISPVDVMSRIRD